MSRFIVVVVAIVFFQVVEDTLAGPVAAVHSDQEPNPCEDFYTFVCGEGELTKERIKIVGKEPQDVVVGIEDYFLTSNSVTNAEKKIYEWKEQCAQLAKGDRKEFIRRFSFPKSIGGWPVYEKNWKGENFNLQNAISELGGYGIPVIFQLKLDTEPNTFGSRILIETMSTSHLSSESRRKEIKEELSSTIDNIDEVLNDSALVESWFGTALTNDGYEKPLQTNFKGLKNVLPSIDWDQQVKAVFDHQIPDDFPVKIEEYKALKEVLSKSFQGEPKVMANYILYQFASNLEDLKVTTTYDLFKNVLFQVVTKQSYKSWQKVDELRDMLHAILKTLRKAEMLFNNEEEDEIESKIASFIRLTIPTINDTYYDNVYEEFEVTPDDCYSDIMKLRKINIKMENENIWKFGPLSKIQPALVYSFFNQLTIVSNSSSAYRFRNLALVPIMVFVKCQNGLYNHKTLKDCEKKETEKDFEAGNYVDYLGIPLLVRSYFDWADSNPDLIELEAEKFGIDSKASLMEQVMLSYCDKNIEKSTASKLSWNFARLKEFQETFNCPGEVSPVLEDKCFNNATRILFLN